MTQMRLEYLCVAWEMWMQMAQRLLEKLPDEEEEE